MGVIVYDCHHCNSSHLNNRCPAFLNIFQVGDIVHVEGNLSYKGPHVIIHIKDELCYAMSHSNIPFMFHHQEAKLADLFKVPEAFLQQWSYEAICLARTLFL